MNGACFQTKCSDVVRQSLAAPSDVSGSHCSVLLDKAPPCRPQSQSNVAAFYRGLGFWGREFNSLRSASCSRTEPSEGRFIFLFFYFFCLYDSVWIVAFSDMHLFIAARFYVPHSAASHRSFGLFTFPLCHPPFTSHLFFPPEIVLSPLLQTSVRLASSSSSSLSSLPSLSSPSSLPFFPLPPSNVFPLSV